MSATTLPAGVSPALQAIWLSAHDREPSAWDRAHGVVQDDPSREGAWVHAYLHRVEGDESNAGYWYARAGRKPPGKSVALDAEREAITRELLGRG